jgi:hypothetical protein
VSNEFKAQAEAYINPICGFKTRNKKTGVLHIVKKQADPKTPSIT